LRRRKLGSKNRYKEGEKRWLSCFQRRKIKGKKTQGRKLTVVEDAGMGGGD